MELKPFLQDVETGHSSCPAGTRDRFFAGVVSRLRDAARDAVAGASINSIDTLKNALRKYFAPRKTYTHYCAEIQGIRMHRNETVMEYYNRVKRLMESAKASLRETFEADQIPDMQIMLEGIALESFKRGLSDEFIYALSVQEPATLTAAANHLNLEGSTALSGAGKLRPTEKIRHSGISLHASTLLGEITTKTSRLDHPRQPVVFTP